MWYLRTARHRSRPILLRLHSVVRGCRAIYLESHLSEFCPDAASVFSVLTLELFGHPDHCAVDHGAVIAGQIHDARFDDEATDFDQVPCALAALLPVRISCRACAPDAGCAPPGCVGAPLLS